MRGTVNNRSLLLHDWIGLCFNGQDTSQEPVSFSCRKTPLILQTETNDEIRYTTYEDAISLRAFRSMTTTCTEVVNAVDSNQLRDDLLNMSYVMKRNSFSWLIRYSMTNREQARTVKNTIQCKRDEKRIGFRFVTVNENEANNGTMCVDLSGTDMSPLTICRQLSEGEINVLDIPSGKMEKISQQFETVCPKSAFSTFYEEALVSGPYEPIKGTGHGALVNGDRARPCSGNSQ